jgi:hypothetical protein
MDLFSKWGTAIPRTSIRLDELDLGRDAKVIRPERIESSALAAFLREQHLITVDCGADIEHGRQLVEKSGLLPIMFDTCTVINTLAKRVIVDGHSFLPPEPILCCFTYLEDGAEYFMRLELQAATPTLVFSELRWRDEVTSDVVRWVYRLAGIEPITANIKLVHEFQDISVSVEQVREWFKYLISGMEHSHKPSF